MRESFIGRLRWTIWAFIGLSLTTVLFFQNCGKAGFDSGDGSLGGLSSLSSSSVNPALSTAPFPLDANFNQISYMSCPKAGVATTASNPNDLQNAFYNVRAGGYDNTAYATALGAGSLSAAEKEKRLKAGVGVSNAYLDYIGQFYGNEDVNTVQRAIQAHPAINSANLTMALIYEQRSHQPGGFTWDVKALFRPLLDNLTGSTMAAYIANVAPNSKQSNFSTLDPALQSLEGSMSWTQNEVDRDHFKSMLGSGLDLVLGYLDNGSADMTQLRSPDNDPYKTIYGRGYRMTFSMQSSDGLVAPTSTFVSSIEEMDMSKKPLISLSSAQSEQWSCFSLRIVRNVDRLDPCTGRPYTVAGFHDKYNCINGVPSGTVVHNVRVACPTQTVTSMNTYVTEGGRTYQKNMLRLQMARRSLPAELWQVNTDPSFMCAVPTDKALGTGSCYASGDADSSVYIQYDLQDPVRGGCGGAANECPAYVSICYRNQ